MDPTQGHKKREKDKSISSHKSISKSLRFSSLPGRKNLPGSSLSFPFLKDRISSTRSDPPFVLARFRDSNADEQVLSVAFSESAIKWPRTETGKTSNRQPTSRKVKPDYGSLDNLYQRNTIGREIIEDIIDKITTSHHQNQETTIPSSKTSKSIMKSEVPQSERRASIQSERRAAIQSERRASIQSERRASIQSERRAAIQSERWAAIQSERWAAIQSERRASLQSSERNEMAWEWFHEPNDLPCEWDPNEHRDSLVLGMPHRRGSEEYQRSRRSSIASSTASQSLPEAADIAPLYPPRRPLPAPRGTRIELHVHLMGAVRPTTIWELMKEKRLKMPGDGSVQAVQKAIRIRDPVDVYQYSHSVHHFTSAIAGDLYAMERVAFELCEDKVQEGVLYFEARYSPDLYAARQDVAGFSVKLKLRDVVGAVTRGFTMGEMEFGITVRTILCITSYNSNATDIFNLCQDFRDHGVVGIDYHFPYWMDPKDKDEVPMSHDGMKLFTKARHEGVHRTVHAGFLGGANMVNRAVEKYHAERIGHGYNAVQDLNIYNKCLERDIHFECCPWESILIANGPVLLGTVKHPITKFAEDNANFSLNTGHPTVTGMTLQKEYDLACKWGFSELHLARSNVNALRSSFIPENEKKILMLSLMENLGITQKDAPTDPHEELFEIPQN